MAYEALPGCDHELLFTLTGHAVEAGFSRPSSRQRTAATASHEKGKPILEGSTKLNKPHSSVAALHDSNPTSFPAPLLLPGDDLALDPKYPPQSRLAWIREKDRNKVTNDRKTIYIAAPPELNTEVEGIRKWSEPRRQRKGAQSEALARHPETQDIVDYISAFYHGLPVKLFLQRLCFVKWDSDEPRSAKGKAKSTNPSYIGLTTTSECIGIRTRTTPRGDFSHQLNLDDILDVAISSLPDDAYALVFLVEQDLYEDDDDAFVCGRAYGGSRVAVISMARYRPDLDQRHEVDRGHAWPASHCKKYLEKYCKTAPSSTSSSSQTAKQKKNLQAPGDVDQPISISSSENEDEGEIAASPFQAAVSAHVALPSLEISPSVSALTCLWLGRVCRTVSHELGHCFGIDHCVYYACVMQGSASVAEDARQPPYLCPVDLSKVLQAIGIDEVQHYKALLRFCHKHRNTHLFAAYGAWIRSRLAEIEALE